MDCADSGYFNHLGPRARIIAAGGQQIRLLHLCFQHGRLMRDQGVERRSDRLRIASKPRIGGERKVL